MAALLLILLSSVLVITVVLAEIPQWRPFVAVTGIFDGARAVAAASLLTVPITAVSSWLIAELLLTPAGLQYLRTPVFLTVALIVVPLAESALRWHGRLQPQRPGFMLTALTNPTLLGVAFIAEARMERLVDAALFAVGGAAALGALLIAFAALYERMRHADVPRVFREAPLSLVTAGVMALAFMGFTGLIQE
ncbi:MAG: Rnf-Nqr domain containing protein [Steroidobacteraceae bacterium]